MGVRVGRKDGSRDGFAVGISVGALLGLHVGSYDGFAVGISVGALLGRRVGSYDGFAVGISVGDLVGRGVGSGVVVPLTLHTVFSLYGNDAVAKSKMGNNNDNRIYCLWQKYVYTTIDILFLNKNTRINNFHIFTQVLRLEFQ